MKHARGGARGKVHESAILELCDVLVHGDVEHIEEERGVHIQGVLHLVRVRVRVRVRVTVRVRVRVGVRVSG